MSDEEWIGKLPSTWTVARLGALGSLSKGSGGSKEDNRDYGVPVVRYGELYGKYDRVIREPLSFIDPDDSSRYTPLPTGSIVFAASGEDPEEIGKSALSRLPAPAFVGGDSVIFTPRGSRIDVDFLTYVLDAKPLRAYRAIRASGFTVVHITAGKLKTLPIPLPPLDEQRAIADYLNHETAQSDALVAKQEEFIKLLRERRTGLIEAAVTGKSDDVAMDNDTMTCRATFHTRWMGMVPPHWEVVEPRRIFFPRRQSEQYNDVQLTPSQKFGVLPQTEYMRRTGARVVQNLSGTKMQHVEPGDFISHLRTFQGGLELVRQPGKVSPAYTVVTPTAKAHPEFFRYVFKSAGYISQIASVTGQLRDGQSIRFPQFNETWLPLPPFEEQRAIAAYLDEKSNRIDALIAKAEQHIALAKERRSALIAAAVTGQFDVRTARKGARV